MQLSLGRMELIIKKKEDFDTTTVNIFYPGCETHYYGYIDNIRVVRCEGAIRKKMNAGISYFSSVIEVEEEFQKKGYSRKVFDFIHNDLGLPITPINVNNLKYCQHLRECKDNKFTIESPLSEQELDEHKKFWRNKG